MCHQMHKTSVILQRPTHYDDRHRDAKLSCGPGAPVQHAQANLIWTANMKVAKLMRLPERVAQLGRLVGHDLVDGEPVIIEEKIHGHFEKFNSNSGWSSGHVLPDALSDWSWVHTNGQQLLCDLQGHRSELGDYIFTDPALLSPHGVFGCTDLGAEGISAWFQHHASRI